MALRLGLKVAHDVAANGDLSRAAGVQGFVGLRRIDAKLLVWRGIAAILVLRATQRRLTRVHHHFSGHGSLESRSCSSVWAHVPDERPLAVIDLIELEAAILGNHPPSLHLVLSQVLVYDFPLTITGLLPPNRCGEGRLALSFRTKLPLLIVMGHLLSG